MNEQILTGKKYRVLADEATGTWNRISFWNKAADTEMNDGTTVEKKVTDLTESLNTISSNESFYFDKKDGVFGFNTSADRGADTFHPFKSGNNFIKVANVTNLTSGNWDGYTVDVKNVISDYKKLDSSNFILEVVSMQSVASVTNVNDFTDFFTKSYDSSTGILTFNSTKMVNNNKSVIKASNVNVYAVY